MELNGFLFINSCAGAGTAADCDMVTLMVQSQLELLSLNTGREPRVATVIRILKQYLFRYQGNFFVIVLPKIGAVIQKGSRLGMAGPRRLSQTR